VRLDNDIYELLRTRAAERGMSISALVRELLNKRIAAGDVPLRIEDFSFIGSGRGPKRKGLPISEMHDEELAPAYKE